MAGRLRRHLLLALEPFTGIAAVGGSSGLFAGRLGLSDTLLQGSPFSDYRLPGLALSVGVGGGGPNLVAAALMLRGNRRNGALASLAIGWQLFLQPVCFALSLLLLGLALAELRAQATTPTPRKQLAAR